MKTRNRDSRGFTIMELMVVVGVIAIIASLATGAAIKAVRGSRLKRAKSTKVALQAAIENYHAAYNKWPFRVNNMYQSTHSRGLYWAYDQDHPRINKNNSVVFEEMLDSNVPYLDASALLCEVNGNRMTVKDALERGLSPSDICIGYPNPSETSQFFFYGVRYNSDTDSVKVYTKDEMDKVKDHEF
ncbi:MAG: prepilin-type N-terminal cleavage/methylation domain-containing protein [Kiritimatiellia bacterium]